MAKKRRKKTNKSKELKTDKTYLPFELGDLLGLDKNLVYHLSKKYKNERKSYKEWINILGELE